MMQPPQAGMNSAAEYMVSGMPWVTSSLALTSSAAYQLDFPFLTRHIWIHNTSATTLFVGFTANGVKGTNRFSIASSGTFGDSMLRVKSLFFLTNSGSGTAEVVAGLTFVPAHKFPTLTGSVIPGSGSQGDLSIWGPGSGLG